MNENSATIVLPSPKLKKMEITSLKLFCSLYSIFTYIFDVAFDIVVAVKHFSDGNERFFALTICFIIVPGVIMTSFSLWWYLSDNQNKNLKVSTTHWVVRIIFLILLMAPILRNFEALYYAWRSIKSAKPKEKEKFCHRMIYENADATLLRLFEAFMECAPQLVLQIYIFAQVQSLKPNIYTSTETIQLISIFTSLLSMSCVITAYLRSLRESLDEKNELSYSVSIFPLLWRFFELTSRVMVLGLFASVFPYYFWLVCAVHFIIMFMWIRIMNTEFCDNQFGECVYNIVLGIIFIFCYFNPKDNPTRQRSAFYYTLMFLENTALMVLWFHYYSSDVHLKQPAMFLHFLTFALGIVMMLIYYILFHPTTGVIGRNSKSKTKVSETEVQDDDDDIKLNDIGQNIEQPSSA